MIGELTAEIPIEKIDDLLSNTEKHVLYDKMLDKYTLLKTIEQTTQILHWVNKTGFMNPAWDYVISISKHILTSGEIVHTFFSTESSEMPEQEKVTWSNFFNGIWIL